jgi:ABC-type multidrug transport system fused ATPase/permease subunit
MSSNTHESVRETISRALDLLGKKDRRIYRFVILAQILTAFLDLAGVLLFGLIGLLGTSLVKNTEPPSYVAEVLEAFGLGSISLTNLIAWLAVFAAVILLLKSVFSALLMRKVFSFLGSRQAKISSELTTKLFSEPISSIQQRSSQEYSYALSQGIFSAVTLTLGSLSLLISEIALLGFLSIALLLISPIVTIASFVFFAIVGFLLQKSLGSWATSVGNEISENIVESNSSVQEVISTYRELSVLGRRDLFVNGLTDLWRISGRARADQIFIESLPKIAYETALVIGGIGLAIWQFGTSTPEKAISVLVLFIVAGSRVLPSMLRLNSLLLHVRGGIAQARIVFPIADELENSPSLPFPKISLDRLIESRNMEFQNFIPRISVNNASVNYPKSSNNALNNIDIEIVEGSRVAIVGSSGAGKSTLADAILGIIDVSSGEITISGVSPTEAISEWPGCISYVPQTVALLNGSIRENIALGIERNFHDDSEILHALARARLSDLIRDSPKGLETWIGENGVQLSGGQRQRLGLARAFYAKSKLYVFDEATSALDAETEFLISEAIQEIGPDVTTITIAHRLATIKDSEHIIYLESGRVVAQGNFDQICSQNATFRLQAQISGLF